MEVQYSLAEQGRAMWQVFQMMALVVLQSKFPEKVQEPVKTVLESAKRFLESAKRVLE